MNFFIDLDVKHLQFVENVPDSQPTTTKFAVKLLIWSIWTKKISTRGFRELSIGVQFIQFGWITRKLSSIDAEIVEWKHQFDDPLWAQRMKRDLFHSANPNGHCPFVGSLTCDLPSDGYLAQRTRLNKSVWDRLRIFFASGPLGQPTHLNASAGFFCQHAPNSFLHLVIILGLLCSTERIISSFLHFFRFNFLNGPWSTNVERATTFFTQFCSPVHT